MIVRLPTLFIRVVQTLVIFEKFVTYCHIQRKLLINSYRLIDCNINDEETVAGV
jgi:hypothetical protein